MKKFFTDYYEMVWLNSWGWLKKHWLGYSLILIAATIAPWLIGGVKEKLDERKNKKIFEELLNDEES